MSNYQDILSHGRIWFNMDTNLLSHGIRKAPKGTIDQLEQIIKAALPKDWFIGDALDMAPTFSDAAEDLSIPGISVEDFMPDWTPYFYFLSDKGIPYLRCLIGDEWRQAPVCAMLYFDGSDIRGYIPKYGNSFNLKTNTAFESESEGERDPTGEYELVVDGSPKIVSFDTPDDFVSFMEEAFAYIEPNLEACSQDFSCAVEPEGVLSDEDVKKACCKLCKTVGEYLTTK